MEGDSSESSSWATKALVGSVVGAVAILGGWWMYRTLGQSRREAHSNREETPVKEGATPTKKKGEIAAHHEPDDAGGRPEQVLTRPPQEGGFLFPYVFEDYKIGLPKLHQCYCGKSAGQGHALSRCASCKATYYCSSEHQKLAWGGPPLMHRAFCPRVAQILGEGFSAIGAFMAKFSPQNIQSIGLPAAVEGWTIICAALEKKVYANAYEEAKLVHWAGTCHAMLCGQLMKEQLSTFDLPALLRFFMPSINFFENVLAVAEYSDRRVEVAPFANFELFGLWSSLGIALKERDPLRMEKMFSASAVRYGIPAIRDMLELITTNNANVDQNQCLQNLQQWVQSILTILTQKKVSFPMAEDVVLLMERSVNEEEPNVGLLELTMFARCLYESGVDAHAEIERRFERPDSEWGQEQAEAYQQARQLVLQQKMTELFPELMNEPPQ